MNRDKKVVSAAELVRGFSKYREEAAREPLFISNHGRHTHVMLGIDRYERLLAESSRKSQSSGSFSGNDFEDMIEWSDDAVVIFDRSLTIVCENRVMRAITRRTDGSHKGQLLLRAYPEMAGTLIESHVRHTVATGEPAAVDLPSPFASKAWLGMRAFPIGTDNALVFRNISEEVMQQRNAVAKAALLHAMEAHGGIGYVRVSLRGTIEHADVPFCQMVGLSKERLMRVPMADLVERSQRGVFRTALDNVLSGNSEQSLAVALLDNTGADIQVRAGMAPLLGALGAEAAAIVMTRHQGETA
jgi:hypothetical protein